MQINSLDRDNINSNYYMPSEDLIGGSVPYIEGKDEVDVFYAASKACGSENIYYCYSIDADRCWYLATRSEAFANNPDSWCPLAAALPGNTEHKGRDIIHVYEQNNIVGVLKWDKDSGDMRVYFGSARVVLPKVQSMGGVFETIDAEEAVPVMWRNKSLNNHKLSRSFTKKLFSVGILIIFISLLLEVAIYSYSNKKYSQFNSKNISGVTLAINRLNFDKSNIDRHLAKIIGLLNSIGNINGVLTRYEVGANNIAEWTASIPKGANIDNLSIESSFIEGKKNKIKGRYTM